jgi:hypothetical protein
VNIVFDGRLRADSAPPMVTRHVRPDVPRPIAQVARPHVTYSMAGLFHCLKAIPRAVPKLADTWIRSDADDHLDVEQLTRQEEIKLVHRLFLQPGSGRRRSVLFTGVERDNGCTGICARAGKTLAAALEPKSVCVVDANLRSPELHQHVRELGGLFEYVLISAPPINLHAESLALARLVDGVVLIVEANTTRRETVRDMKARLEVLHVPVLGIVLNDRTFPIPEVVYRRL